MGFTQTHDGTVAVAFENIADSFIQHGAFCAIHISGRHFDLLISSGGF
jgi:hypothetical protein